MDKYLIEFCKEEGIEIDKLTKKQERMIKNTLSFNVYALRESIIEKFKIITNKK
ncbi:hypothetical protein [Paraclostridium sp. AKS73]|uniref:hypothetical protein n=1 Tax=Paraclostridium sp. AKS73 TaxID=2876116 RepID=UPI0021DF8D4A|nr:hypothetical protein [Paraclostridium sp. AKS73]MCU9815857.1 hypothetical protein [Paraclostridium sp. AKS73]